MTPITETELAAIEARAANAVSWPWHFDESSGCIMFGLWDGRDKDGVICQMAYDKYVKDGIGLAARINGDFIAHAREDVPRLCAALRLYEKFYLETKQFSAPMAETCDEIEALRGQEAKP
ncbi:MAG: hypothetical protein A3E78_09230 [Alphaproteobacteria bacterium RIFCSPHIGHO2_12_FULL_63_12]|nr:MAG: hypothetical protein A3E78_09230 [Alphaproteobacteria bacterium RIFCSPHIGHO2_12_FULL_63_12]